MKFRTDINGLRTYAVLAVIIFHFNKSWLPGGFAGVDVFFVISGYLMTSIIFRGIENQSFSLWRFYSARIRRIMPALLVLIVILMIFGYLFLAPIPYADLAKHSGGSLLFISNIMYWQESGYFDAAAIEKFLLHTWSLSVEWQFYMIYPIALLLLAKIFSIKTLKKILLAGTILAFLFAVYASFKWSTASYFLLPSRIWEMLLGSIVFLYPLKLSNTKHKYALELIGLALIIASFFIISENTVWPGYMALIPTLGAFILLQANNENSLFTNNLVAQKIGLWSYSLYLYHWPLLVINHRYNLDLSFIYFFIITMVLSVLSYYLIEKRQWHVNLVLAVSFLGIISMYFGIYKTKGADFRIEAQYSLTAEEYHKKFFGGIGYSDHLPSYINTAEREAYDYMVFGDSFSRQYAQFIKKENLKVKAWFADGCILLQNHTRIVENKEWEICSNNSNAIFSQWLDPKEGVSVVWAQNWSSYTMMKKNGSADTPINFANQPEIYQSIIKDEISAIAADNPMATFYIIGQPIQPEINVFSCLAESQLLIKKECPTHQPYKKPQINNLLEEIGENQANAHYIDPNASLCSDEQCILVIDGNPIFSDATHLSIYGADIVGRYIFDEIKKIERSR